MPQRFELTPSVYEALIKQLADLDDYLQALDEEEYDPAKREYRRNFIRDYLERGQGLLSSIKVDEKNEGKGMPVVMIGCRVDLQDSNGRNLSLTLGSPAQDNGDGSISVFSPVGQALLFKTLEEKVTVEAPGGRFTYQIKAIHF